MCKNLDRRDRIKKMLDEFKAKKKRITTEGKTEIAPGDDLTT